MPRGKRPRESDDIDKVENSTTGLPSPRKKSHKKNNPSRDNLPLIPYGSQDTILVSNPFDDIPCYQPRFIMHNRPPRPAMHGAHLPLPSGTGKVYPPNQPMIFNPANPNAPPIYPCGICHKEVHDNDQAILCESGCNFWFHRICTGLTEAAYQLLTQEVYAEWVCDKCLNTKSIPLIKMKP